VTSTVISEGRKITVEVTPCFTLPPPLKKPAPGTYSLFHPTSPRPKNGSWKLLPFSPSSKSPKKGSQKSPSKLDRTHSRNRSQKGAPRNHHRSYPFQKPFFLASLALSIVLFFVQTVLSGLIRSLDRIVFLADSSVWLDQLCWPHCFRNGLIAWGLRPRISKSARTCPNPVRSAQIH
jgi:hypothetical protein